MHLLLPIALLAFIAVCLAAIIAGVARGLRRFVGPPAPDPVEVTLGGTTGAPLVEVGRTHCVACGARDSLEPLLALDRRGEPHGAPGHDVVFDRWVVSACRQCRGGTLEHYSHDCWNHPGDDEGDPWELYFYWAIDGRQLRSLLALVRDCPAPHRFSCPCRVHRGLRDDLDRLGVDGPRPASVTLPSGEVSNPPWIRVDTRGSTIRLVSR